MYLGHAGIRSDCLHIRNFRLDLHGCGVSLVGTLLGNLPCRTQGNTPERYLLVIYTGLV